MTAPSAKRDKAAPAFTPGPWSAVHGVLRPDDEGHARSFVRPVRSEGYQIAQTCGPNGTANAQLIASAPDMANQLLEMLEYFDERADADHNGVAFVANEEMAIATCIREILTKAGVRHD